MGIIRKEFQPAYRQYGDASQLDENYICSFFVRIDDQCIYQKELETECKKMIVKQ